MKKINFVSAHVLSEVVEDTLDLLIMWCDERYAYDDRPYEQIPCDEVAAEYLATIACCLQVTVNAHDYRTLCKRNAQGLVEEYQHELDNTKEEIEMTNEVKKYQTMCRNCGEVFDVWVSDEDLNKPQFHICEDCVAEEEIKMMNEEDCVAEEERFPAGENHIDVCHRCGFVFEVQDLIPVERYRGFGGDNHNIVVFFCKECFEEEYHAGLE